MSNGTTEDPTTASIQNSTTTGDIIQKNSTLFLGLFLGTAFILIATIGTIAYKKISKQTRRTGTSESELLTCRAIDTSYKDSIIDVTTPVQNVSQPAASNRLFVEEVSETEPEYDYPEIFQFRLQLQGVKRQPKGPIQSPKSKGQKYVNIDNDDPGEDSDCHYLTPRQYDPGEDTDDYLEEQHSEEPFYDSPSPEMAVVEISSRLCDGYVKVKPEVPRKPVFPRQIIIQELQQHFQNPNKKSLQSTAVSKASPSCHCMKKCNRKPCKVPSNAVDHDKDHLPKKSFPKKRYENIPD